MRDPQGALSFEGGRVFRRLTAPLAIDHFLRSDLAQRWVDRGDLVHFEMQSEDSLFSPRLGFITYPHEWCDSQLYAAAQLTLRLQQEAVDAGFDLKDASAWNIIFDGRRPVFCDLLSFQRLEQRKWWAAGQFSRHFLFPLLVSRIRGLKGYECFSVWRDGVPENSARDLLGSSRLLTRYWPLMTTAKSSDVALAGDLQASNLEDIHPFRRSLHGALTWMLKGVEPAFREWSTETYWQNYSHERSHYDRSALDGKRAVVKRWLEECAPHCVIDMGCNSGEFTRLAAELCSKVIAVDGDHGAMQLLWASAPLNVHPVVGKLDDLSGGRGWEGVEHEGLMSRLEAQSDVTLMLALIHHLAIDSAIPLSQIARFAYRCTRRWLIVEYLAQEDVQLKSLCLHRQRDPTEFSMDRQRSAFVEAGFNPVEEVTLGGTGTRTLALLARESAQ